MGRYGGSRFGQTRYGEGTPTQVRPGSERLSLVEPAVFVGAGSWYVAGTRVIATDATLNPAELQLSIRTKVHSKAAAIRQLNRQAGEFERVPLAGGGWTTVDRSQHTNNTIAVSPPSGLRPPLKPARYHVDRYDERSSPDGRVIDIDLGLIRTRPREIDDVLQSPSPGQDEWLLEFETGAIATELVSRTDQGRQADVDLRATLTDAEVAVLLENATRPDSVTVRAVPDGDDYVSAASDRQRVRISLPSGASNGYLPTDGGDYAIREWEVRRTDPYSWQARFTVRELSQ